MLYEVAKLEFVETWHNYYKAKTILGQYYVYKTKNKWLRYNWFSSFQAKGKSIGIIFHKRRTKTSAIDKAQAHFVEHMLPGLVEVK